MIKIKSIQFIRAVAALAVLGFHTVGTPFVAGAAGVDLFFVISGFIMGTFGSDVPPQRFLYHRIVRIVPLYWAVTLVMCVGAMMGMFSTFTFTPEQLWMSLLFIPYFNDAGEVAPLVVVGWTLNMEMFFYAVFAVGLALRAPVAVTAVILGLMTLAGLVLDLDTPVAQSWMSPLLLEFLAGLFLARMALPRREYAAPLIGLSLAGFALAAVAGSDPAGLWRVLIWGVPSFLLVAGCLTIEKAGAWPQRLLAPVEKIGDASYALYLLHGLVISAVYRLVEPGFFAAAAIVVLSLAVAFAAHVTIEKPATQFLRRFGGRTVRYPAAPARSMNPAKTNG